MSDEALQRDVSRGYQAKALLENEFLKETFQYLKQSYVDAWMESRTPEMRESNWYSIHALQRFNDHLVTVLRDGKLAQAQIEQMIKRPKRAA